LSQLTTTGRFRIEPTWWAPIAVACVAAVPVGAFLPILLGQVAGAVEFPISMVGLVAAVMGFIRERRVGWRVAALLAGLFHLALVALYVYLSLLMEGVLSF